MFERIQFHIAVHESDLKLPTEALSVLVRISDGVELVELRACRIEMDTRF